MKEQASILEKDDIIDYDSSDDDTHTGMQSGGSRTKQLPSSSDPSRNLDGVSAFSNSNPTRRAPEQEIVVIDD